MPIYTVRLTRRRTGLDESTITVRASRRFALLGAEGTDIDALEAERKITWNSHDETHGAQIEEIEEVDDDDDDMEVDVDLDDTYKSYRIDMKVEIGDESTIDESKVVGHPANTLTDWVNGLQDCWEDQIAFCIEETGDRKFDFSLWLTGWDSLEDAESTVTDWIANLKSRWTGLTVTIEHKEEDWV
jgi:hypothetical protein